MEWAIGATITALFGGGVFLFNRLVHHRNLVMQAFADIDVQLKRRADLVPRLVETVRAYAAHERTTLLAVTELRAQAQAIGTRGTDGERFAAETRLGAALKQLVVLQENYPALKADANFRDLAARLIEVEDQLQFARRFYNGAVKQYLTRLQTFPDLLLARYLAFRPVAFFESDTRDPVEVRL